VKATDTQHNVPLDLAVPQELPDQVTQEIVPKLVTGLTKLRFQKYKILKEGGTKVIASSP
jgi:hypothetical protein